VAFANSIEDEELFDIFKHKALKKLEFVDADEKPI